MSNLSSIKSVAFDLGNVLATQNLDVLDIRERALLKAYLNRFNPARIQKEAAIAGETDAEKFLKEAEASIDQIFPKIHVMSEQGMDAIKLVKEVGLQPSIWTNNIFAINKWFEEIGLYDHIDPKYICNSIAMGQGNSDKPDREFYRLALTQLRNDAREVLFIDDTLENVAAGLGYSIPSIQFDLQKQTPESKPLGNVAIETVEAIAKVRR